MTTEYQAPAAPTTEQIVRAIDNLQKQITDLKIFLGIPTGANSGDGRTELGQGAPLNKNSPFI